MYNLSQHYNIYVITVNDVKTDFLLSLRDYHVRKLKTLRGRVKLYKLLNPLTMIELFLLARQFPTKTTLVITNDFSGEFLLGTILPKIKRIYISRGGNYNTMTGKLLRWISFKSTDKFITVSETEKSKLVNIGISPSKIRVIFNSIIPQKCLKPAIIDKNSINITCVGYYNKNKNQLLATKAVNQLVNEGYNITLNLYGSYSYSNKAYIALLQQFIKKNKLQNNIILHEYTSKIDIFQNNQILLSTSKDEGFGNTILDAFVYKRPVITTNSGGLSSMLRNGEHALVVNDFSVKTICQSIKMLIENNKLVELLTQNAYNLYLSEFKNEIQMKKYEAQISELMTD